MSRWLRTAGRWYNGYARGLTYLKDAALLVVRVYWGWQLIAAGWGKLANVAPAAQFFESIGIPFPAASAVVSGCGEFFGGLLLLAGLASRVAALLVFINMTVAMLTAHTENARAIFTAPAEFISSPPFTFLLASLLVLLFGPGVASLDALVRHCLIRRGLIDRATGSGPPAADTNDGKRITRRDMGRLTAAVVAGLLTGVGLLRGRSQKAIAPAADGGPPPAANLPAIQDIDAKAPPGIQPSLLLEEPHTCCGMNTCKGKAKDMKNECSGRGACATASAHGCQAQNDCKGQGGCGEYPGQNTCKGKGGCGVPMKRQTWAKARKRFEELMRLAGKTVGGPPPNCPKA